MVSICKCAYPDLCVSGAENGTVPTERTELMDKKERDSSILKSDDTRSHISGISSHPSHSSHSSRRLGYDKLCFPRHDLQTLRVLGVYTIQYKAIRDDRLSLDMMHLGRHNSFFHESWNYILQLN